MNKPFIISLIKRGTVMAVLLGAAGGGTSCMTTYDAYGRPVQAVDPGMAVAGAAAAGLVGYAIANNNNYYHGGYYHPHAYYRSGYYAPNAYYYHNNPSNPHHNYY